MIYYTNILLILGFLHPAICYLSNVTYDDSNTVCPVKWFRKKRTPPEYTRWKTNLETESEFLVKVLDDELTSPSTQKIVAVNIQPITKGREKIIVGGVIIPPVTTPKTISEVSRDYTRFVPHTNLPITRLEDDLFLAPQSLPKIYDKIPPIKPKLSHNSQRDESPPASPQFLIRTPPTVLARQYAPIAQVAFTRGPTISPPNPISYKNLQHSTEDILQPTRTTRIPEIMRPRNTDAVPEEFKDLQNFVHDVENELGITQSTYHSIYNLHRTSTMKITIDEEPVPVHTEGNFYEIGRKFDSEILKSDMNKNSVDNEGDNAYKMVSYGDEDNESNNKKEQDIFDMYEDKVKPGLDPDAIYKEYESNDFVQMNRTTNGTVAEPEYYDESDSNVTLKNSQNENIEAISPEKGIKDPRKVCNLVKLRKLNFNTLHTLPEIVSQLKLWADNSPLVKWEDITAGNLTTMENPIYLMIVDDPSSGQILSAKLTVMIVAGIQGRDHHAVTAAMYVLYQLIERSESHADLLSKYRFWIIPVFNPDGYDYSMTFPHRREWSKNLRQNWEICKNREFCSSCEKHGLRCTVTQCYGVNLDRNFEYQWIPTEDLLAEHPCGPLHAGARQLSEHETRALTHFLREKRTPLHTFIAFKEGEVLGIMYPYSHTRKLRAFDHVYRERASRAASAAYSISGRSYVAGQTSEFLPLYAGGIEDWVDGHLGIDNTYTVMMFRPTDSYKSKLVTERIVHEAYAATDTLLLQSVESLGPPPVTLKRSNVAYRHRSWHYLVILLTTCLVRLTLQR